MASRDELLMDEMITEGPEFDPNDASDSAGSAASSMSEGDQSKLASKLRKLVDKARRERSQFDRRATECKRYRLYGDPEINTKEGDSRVRANLINDVLKKMAAVATDHKPQSVVTPRRPEAAIAARVQNDIQDYLWNQNNMDAMQPLIHMERWTSGCVVGKVSFNPFLRGGDVEDELVDVRRMTWDTSVDLMRNIQRDARWVAEESWPAKSWLAQVYPDRAAGIARIPTSKPSFKGKREGAELSPIVSPEWSQATKDATRYATQIPGDGIQDDGEETGVRLIDFWQRPDIQKDGSLDQGKHIIICGDLVLENDINPYWDVDEHAFPYAFSPTDEEAGEEGAISLVYALYPLHRQICEMLRMMANHASREAYSRLLYERDTVLAEDLKNGEMYLPVDSMAGGSDPRWIQAGTLGQSFMAVFDVLLKEFYDTAGVQDSDRGAAVGQVSAAAAFKQLQAVFQRGVRLDVSAVESFLDEMGAMRVSRVEQFWTQERTFRVAGADAQDPMFLTVRPHIVHDPITDQVTQILSPFHDSGGFDYKIRTGSSMPPDQEKLLQMALMGRQMGDISPAQLWSYTPLKFDGPNSQGDGAGGPPGQQGPPPVSADRLMQGLAALVKAGEPVTFEQIQAVMAQAGLPTAQAGGAPPLNQESGPSVPRGASGPGAPPPSPSAPGNASPQPNAVMAALLGQVAPKEPATPQETQMLAP